MERTAPTNRIILGLTVALLSLFQTGYHSAVLNIPQTTFLEYLNSSYKKTYGSHISDELVLDQLWSFIVAIFSGGAVVGALLTNVVAERCGRKNGLLIVCNFIGIVGSVLQAFAKMSSFEMLIVGRFLSGVNTGLAGGIEIMFLTESVPSRYRGVAGSTQNLCILLFTLVSQIISLPNLLGTPSGWPYLVGIGLIPGLLQLPLVFYLPESPKYLYITKNNPEASKKAILFYQGNHADYKELFEEYNQEKSYAQEEVGYWAAITNSELRKPLLVAWVANASMLTTGIVCVISYSTSMFVDAGLESNPAQYASIGVFVSAFLGAIVSMPFIMNMDRRRLLLSGLTLTNFCLFLFMAMSLVKFYKPSVGIWCSYVTVAIMVVYAFVYNFGPGPIPWFLPAEMVPQNARSVAMSTSVALNWLLALVSALIYLPLQNRIGPYVIVPFLVCAAACQYYLWLRMPETRNKTVFEIAATFRSSGNQYIKKHADWETGACVEL